MLPLGAAPDNYVSSPTVDIPSHRIFSSATPTKPGQVKKLGDSLSLAATPGSDSSSDNDTLGPLKTFSKQRSFKTKTQRLMATHGDPRALEKPHVVLLEEIEGQTATQRSFANKAIGWVVWAQRPITIWELQHALAVEFGDKEINLERISSVQEILGACCGVLKLHDSGIVEFGDWRQLELWRATLDRGLAQTSIAHACMAYLGLDTFLSGYCQTDKEFERRLQLYPLYSYAAQYCGLHYSNARKLPNWRSTTLSPPPFAF
ncbi:hypothetical protein BDW74DRAFT_32822 [Aspergillus multicolor]|uniref:uncharacterized protein n=1 Tax=Aspergillus multicolor TaxID=41759 RepID=UPI003CCD7A84